jgi:hypothetical protein
MWMSNIFIVVDRRNLDLNSLEDITSAIVCAGGTVMGVNADSHVIEAAVASAELPTIRAMEGVSYVRSVFNYFCNVEPRTAA